MDFFSQELGVSGAQLLLSAEQTLFMVFVSLFLGTILGLIMAVTLVVILFTLSQIQLLIRYGQYHLLS